MRHEDFMKKVNERARVAGKSAQYFPPGETWLPKMLDKSIRSKTSDISEILEWNPNAAMAFCVALLEDVNHHAAARDANRLFMSYVNDEEVDQD